jgi:hypothetical protein
MDLDYFNNLLQNRFREPYSNLRVSRGKPNHFKNSRIGNRISEGCQLPRNLSEGDIILLLNGWGYNEPLSVLWVSLRPNELQYLYGYTTPHTSLRRMGLNTILRVIAIEIAFKNSVSCIKSQPLPGAYSYRLLTKLGFTDIENPHGEEYPLKQLDIQKWNSSDMIRYRDAHFLSYS